MNLNKARGMHFTYTYTRLHRRRNRGGRGGLGPLTFLFEGAQYDRGPLTFEQCRPIFELKVTPYFQS